MTSQARPLEGSDVDGESIPLPDQPIRREGILEGLSPNRGTKAILSGVYSIRNVITGKVYVGSTVKTIETRWYEHRRDLRHGDHKNRYLQRAWNKYGEAAFEFSVLKRCHRDECLILEQVAIDAVPIKQRYNICPKAESVLGRKHKPETAALLAAHLRRISASRIGQRGAKRSAAARANMALAQQGVQKSPEEIERIRALGKAKAGTVASDETKKKQADALRGRKRPPDVVAKYVAKLRSPEVRLNLSLKAKAQWAHWRDWWKPRLFE